MLSSLKSFFYNFRMHPLRGVLILITITVGVATLSVTTSLSMDINEGLDSALAEQGRRVTIVNGALNDEGKLEMQYRFTPNVVSILSTGYENLSDITMVTQAWIKEMVWVDERTYQVRSAIQVSETYAELMNLDMTVGRFFDRSDVDSRKQVVVISALTAQMLFGSPEAALGKSVSLAARTGMLPYAVVGVYKDVWDLEREAYGIGDFILPLLTGVLAEWKIHPIEKGAVLIARISSDSLIRAESRIRSILEPEYGDGLLVGVWEGLPGSTAAPLIEESRRSVSTFALAVSILGFIILATSSIGIFSVMLVEVLNRTRDIGLRRALGTTRGGVRRYFIGQALYYSLIGSAVGVGLSVAFYRTIGVFLTPLFDSAGFRATDIALKVPGLLPIAIAVGSALVFGALFGFFPALSAARTPIIECIREDAA